MPKLSICVPSRNRQIYFMETIKSLVESPRDDVEFVFADNSDDAAVMRDFMAAYADDPRVVFVPAGDRVYSMVDNWERCVAASSGDWVTVIGDDDYADPDLALVLTRVELMLPGVEAFTWTAANFTWPEDGVPQVSNTQLHLKPNLIELPREWLIKRAYLWVDAGNAPTHGFSIYHSALARPLLERIKERFEGRYFQHPTVDFDSSFKAVLLGQRFVMWQRPLSVYGVCPLSNSAVVYKPRQMAEANVAFMAEVGRDISKDSSMEGLPFHCDMGVPAAVLVTQQWIKGAAGISIDGWQENFTRACANFCSKLRTREDFDILSEVYSEAFNLWEGGRYAHAFKPEYSGIPPEFDAFSGITEDRLFMNNRLTGADTPKEVYDMLSALIPPLEDAQFLPSQLRFPADSEVMRMGRQ